MDSKQSLLDVLWSNQDGGTPLSVYQRILLMTDGTVTDLLEAYANETITVVKLAQGLSEQGFSEHGPARAQLEVADDEPVLQRTVLLQGSASGINFLHAVSSIACERLPPGVLEGLLTTGKPLGRLLAERRVETYREILGLGFTPARDCAAYFGVAANSNLVFRTYRIHIQRRPVMRITEQFPVTWFSGPCDL